MKVIVSSYCGIVGYLLLSHLQHKVVGGTMLSLSRAPVCRFKLFIGLVNRCMNHESRLLLQENYLLWPPYVIGQAIIFLPCGFYLLLSSSFFLRLISATADWMSTILRHLVWPECEFRMQVWNLLRTARCKYRTQKIAKKSPSGHHPTTLSGYIFATKACIDNRKKMLSSNMSSTGPHNMVNFGLLAAEICWRVWGTPANFNGFRVLAALLHSIPVLGVSQTLRRWTEGATYIRQGGHHVGHWPTFLVITVLIYQSVSDFNGIAANVPD